MPSSSFPAADPWLPPLVEPVPVVPAPAGRQPRPLWLRVAIGCAAVVAGVELLGLGSSLADELARRGWDVGIDGEPILTLLVVAMWFVLPRVAYRRRDVLMVLIPIYGVWIVALAFYRLAGLPYRDWRPRPDELLRVAQVDGLPRYYVLLSAGANAAALRRAVPLVSRRPSSDRPHCGRRSGFAGPCGGLRSAADLYDPWGDRCAAPPS